MLAHLDKAIEHCKEKPASLCLEITINALNALQRWLLGNHTLSQRDREKQ